MAVLCYDSVTLKLMKSQSERNTSVLSENGGHRELTANEQDASVGRGNIMHGYSSVLSVLQYKLSWIKCNC